MASPYSIVERINCLYSAMRSLGGSPCGLRPSGTREKSAARPACRLCAMSSGILILPNRDIGTPR
jgi:hypothetical protein